MNGLSDAFYLQASAVVVDKAAGGYKISSARRASEVKYGLKAVDTWRADTTVNLKKIPNTDVVAEIGVETRDLTVKTLGEVGGAIVKLAELGLGIRTPEGCAFPLTLPIVSTSADGHASEEVSPTPGCVSIVLAPVPPDAAPRASLPVDADTSNYYYAACRDATVTVTDSIARSAAKTVRVADPRFVQFVRLPTKGSITAHSECGVSVVTKEAPGDSWSAIAEALAAQGKSIRAATD